MSVKAILFGSIGTLIETSELQRRAFNQTFSEAGLDWHWSVELYQSLLKKSGGKDRIQDFATQYGADVDSKALHQQKTKIFEVLMNKETILLRPGVADVIQYALNNKVPLAFVTSTSKANIASVFSALGEQVKRSDFSFIGNNLQVSNPKPSPDIYLKALEKLALNAEDCIAIEDTATSMNSALIAGIKCIGFPGAFAASDDFSGALLVTDKLSLDDLIG